MTTEQTADRFHREATGRAVAIAGRVDLDHVDLWRSAVTIEETSISHQSCQTGWKF